MSMARVAVLAGGRSPEREVSLRSGHRVASALRTRGHDVIIIDPSDGPFVETLSAASVSACYVALHGKEGEDGTVQRLLELLELPYTGTRAGACERAFDKMEAYGQSKTANVLFALELDRRFASRGVHAYSVHPGMIVTTDLGRTMTREDYRGLTERAKASPSGRLPAFKTEAQGAATTVWAATAPELDAPASPVHP